MRLSRIEEIVMSLLTTSDAPLSAAELVERSGFRFVPELIITLALEALLQKNCIQEAGIHRSYAGQKERHTILYAPTVPGTKRGTMT